MNTHIRARLKENLIVIHTTDSKIQEKATDEVYTIVIPGTSEENFNSHADIIKFFKTKHINILTLEENVGYYKNSPDYKVYKGEVTLTPHYSQKWAKAHMFAEYLPEGITWDGFNYVFDGNKYGYHYDNFINHRNEKTIPEWDNHNWLYSSSLWDMHNGNRKIKFPQSLRQKQNSAVVEPLMAQLLKQLKGDEYPTQEQLTTLIKRGVKNVGIVEFGLLEIPLESGDLYTVWVSTKSSRTPELQILVAQDLSEWFNIPYNKYIDHLRYGYIVDGRLMAIGIDGEELPKNILHEKEWVLEPTGFSPIVEWEYICGDTHTSEIPELPQIQEEGKYTMLLPDNYEHNRIKLSLYRDLRGATNKVDKVVCGDSPVSPKMLDSIPEGEKWLFTYTNLSNHHDEITSWIADGYTEYEEQQSYPYEKRKEFRTTRAEMLNTVRRPYEIRQVLYSAIDEDAVAWQSFDGLLGVYTQSVATRS